MSSQAVTPKTGILYTFYSFKGGVGRTMALANVAALLVKWGHSVLAIDWDLEAPGLERFFFGTSDDAERVRASKPGVSDIIFKAGQDRRLDWRECVHSVDINGFSSRLSMITAGQAGDNYVARVQSLNFPDLFENHDLGAVIERYRQEWIAEFDFVLVDSRTGVTDIGGICTAQLADVLVLVFTTTDSSTAGALQILERARKAREHLPVDRRRLIAVPLPSRDESYTEYERAMSWRKRFAADFADAYRDWLPAGIQTGAAVDILRIPYLPYWSFGERLPVLEEGTTDTSSLGYAYEILARLLSTRLDWYAALEGRTVAPGPRRRTTPDPGWLEVCRSEAMAAFRDAGMSGFMEIFHFCEDSFPEKNQQELLNAARLAMVHTSGWPIGAVLDNREDAKPRPTNTGIAAMVNSAALWFKVFDYWRLEKNGDFYSLSSLIEDGKPATANEDSDDPVIYYDTRITRTAEALQHCVKLYQLLGANPNATVHIAIRHGGLKDRALRSSRPAVFLSPRRNVVEDETTATASFRLSSFESDAARIVKQLCDPLFVLFDFYQVPDDRYAQLVATFLSGRAA